MLNRNVGLEAIGAKKKATFSRANRLDRVTNKDVKHVISVEGKSDTVGYKIVYKR